jgi:hypothetical protein
MLNPNPSNRVNTARVDTNDWIWGFTPQAETWNGRFAMIGFVSAIAIELFTHKGVLEFWGILSSGVVPPVS